MISKYSIILVLALFSSDVLGTLELPLVNYRCVINGVVALTFDDGPHNNTRDLLDVLERNNLKSTFFINGANALNIYGENAQNIVRRTINEGHTIASHTWSHPRLTELNSSEIFFQMNELTNALLSLDLIKQKPMFMRPPYGSLNDSVIDIVQNQLNYTIVNWSIDTQDYSHPGDTEAGIQQYAKILNGTEPSTTLGFIALHHDIQNGAAELAEAAILYIKSMDYRVVSLEECLGIQ